MSQKIPHEEIVHIKLNDIQMRENLMTAMHRGGGYSNFTL